MQNWIGLTGLGRERWNTRSGGDNGWGRGKVPGGGGGDSVEVLGEGTMQRGLRAPPDGVGGVVDFLVCVVQGTAAHISPADA